LADWVIDTPTVAEVELWWERYVSNSMDQDDYLMLSGNNESQNNQQQSGTFQLRKKDTVILAPVINTLSSPSDRYSQDDKLTYVNGQTDIAQVNLAAITVNSNTTDITDQVKKQSTGIFRLRVPGPSALYLGRSQANGGPDTDFVYVPNSDLNVASSGKWFKITSLAPRKSYIIEFRGTGTRLGNARFVTSGRYTVNT
jgi:hypothetical protein